MAFIHLFNKCLSSPRHAGVVVTVGMQRELMPAPSTQGIFPRPSLPCPTTAQPHLSNSEEMTAFRSCTYEVTQNVGLRW